jgi:hypothetical protein
MPAAGRKAQIKRTARAARPAARERNPVKITIRIWTGEQYADQEVDAVPTGTPGLVIHRAFEGTGLVLTQVSTGLKTAVFPDDIGRLARELGELGDWTAAPDKALLARAWGIVDSYNALPAAAPAPREAAAAEWARSGIDVTGGDSSGSALAVPPSADTVGDRSRPLTGSSINGAAGSPA